MTMFPESQKVAIQATSRRPTGKPDYFIMASRQQVQRLKLDEWAVLVFMHPAFERLNRDVPFLSIQCRVGVDDNLGVPSVVGTPTCVAVDQTLRNALGIPFRVFRQLTGGEYYLLPAARQGVPQLRRELAQVFGFRSIAVRCHSAHVPDIEKSYVRVPQDVLKAVGVQESDDLILERPLPVAGRDGIIRKFVISEVRMSALAAGDAFLRERKTLMKCFPTRFRDAQRDLYDYADFSKSGLFKTEVPERQLPEPDVPPTFMDAETRASWSVDTFRRSLPGFTVDEARGIGSEPADYLTPLMIRRSIRSALARDSLQTGITFLVVLIQLTLALDLEPGRVSGTEIALALLIASCVSLILLIFRLRQQV